MKHHNPTTNAARCGQKPNPYLSAPLYGLTHFDPGQSDTIPYPVKRGSFHVDLGKASHVPGGPVNIMNLASTDLNYMWAISTARVAYVDVADGHWNAVAELALPGVKVFDAATLQAVF